jgi:hypothetical protein
MSEETTVTVAESVRDGPSEASHSKAVILSNNVDISNTAETGDDDKRAEDEAIAIHDHQYHLTLQEGDKSEDAPVPQP